jgi:hypothetical protein
MKHLFRLITLAALLCVSYLAKAQDVITKTDNTTITVKIVEVGPTFISYRRWSNLSGTVYRIRKDEVKKITYKDGKEQVFNNAPKAATTPPPAAQQEKPAATPTPPPPEAAKPEETTPSQGKLQYTKGGYTLDGKTLTPSQLRQLIGDQAYYQTYENAVKKRKTGKTLSILGGITLAGGAAVAGIGLLNKGQSAEIQYYDADNPEIIYGTATAAGGTGKLSPLVIGGGVAMALGATFLIIGIPVSSGGTRQLKGIADNYNRRSGYGAVLNISPAPYGISLALRF